MDLVLGIEPYQMFEDKKSRAKTLAIPFTFPDYAVGTLAIIKHTKFIWNPLDQIESITINFKKPQ